MVIVCAAALAGAACASSKPEPKLVSSASLPGYATRYPTELSLARNAFTTEEQEAERLLGDFASYPGRLSNPNWATVRDVYLLADTDGKSYAYVERLEQSQGAAAFFVEQKAEIERRVGGAVQYAVKDKKECDVDVATPARVSLEKAVEKQLTESVHDRSDAYQAIQDNQDALGKKNADTLEEQSDSLSRASYLVHVGIYREKDRIDRMVSEASEVKKTLERTISDLDALSKTKLTDARKKQVDQELIDAHAAQNLIDTELQQSEPVKKSAEDRVKKLEGDYDKAFNALVDDVKKRVQ